MRSRLSPALWLTLLTAVAVAVSGWLYGLQWRRVARGGDTTHQERLLIDLQDQLDHLRADNERLTARLHELEGDGPGADPKADPKADPGPGGEGSGLPAGPDGGIRGLSPAPSVEPPGTPPPVAQ